LAVAALVASAERAARAEQVVKVVMVLLQPRLAALAAPVVMAEAVAPAELVVLAG
jgi:hypothetical protein